MKPNALIIRTAGTNCDRELAHAFELAGAQTRSVHLHALLQQPDLISGADLIGFPGGFSYGDDIAAGRIFANRVRHRLFDAFRAAVDRGVPIIGICNGFQVLVKMGLLPDPAAGRQTATLAENTTGRFIDRWVRVQVPEDTACIWTRGLGTFELPIAHGEGRFVPESDAVLDQLRQNRQIALRYAADDNPNGSRDDIAGVCDPTGVVFGLMPHPERYTHPTADPQWTRRTAEALAETPVGLRVFQNAVGHVRAAATQMA